MVNSKILYGLLLFFCVAFAFFFLNNAVFNVPVQGQNDADGRSLQSLQENSVFFEAAQAQEKFPVLKELFSEIKVSLSCDKSSFENQALRQGEDFLECDGVSLENEFKPASGLGVKQLFRLKNSLNEPQKRLMGVRMVSRSSELESDSIKFSGDSELQKIPTGTGSISLEGNDSGAVSAGDGFVKDGLLRFLGESKNVLGVYDWSDLVKAGQKPKTIVYTKDGQTIIETTMEILLEPNQQLELDPYYDLNNQIYSAAWEGGTANDNVGLTNSGQSIQVVNADNEVFANDLLITVPLADTNGNTNNGAVYLVMDSNGFYGQRDLSNSDSYTVAWFGAANSDNLGYVGNTTKGVQLVNVDNGAYANDLLITAVNADTNSKTDNGAVYLIKNIDSLSGGKDLAAGHFDAMWAGSLNSDLLGAVGCSNGCQGVQLLNSDAGAYSNDVVIGAYLSNRDNTNTGSIYLIKNIDSLSGNLDLNTSGNFSAWMYSGAAGDKFGYEFQVVNSDNNSSANDLLVTSPFIDAGSATDTGRINFFRDIGNLSGEVNLIASSINMPGVAANDMIGYAPVKAGNSSFYPESPYRRTVRLENTDGNSYANDLLIVAPKAASGSNSAAGQIYLIKNIDTKPNGFRPLGNTANIDVNFSYGSSGWAIGATNYFGDSVQIVNSDHEAFANDILISNYFNNVPAKGGGVLWLIRDINGLSGEKDLSSTSNFDVRWNGASGGCQLTDIGFWLTNVDGEDFNNDLLIGDSQCGGGSAGVVYLIQDINSLTASGTTSDLSQSSEFTVKWTGSSSSWLGYASGAGVQLVNVDNESFANDLLLTSYLADLNSKTDTGAVWLVRDVNGLSGAQDLTNSSNYTALWVGASSSDFLGLSHSNTTSPTYKDTGTAIQLVNADGGTYANDLLLNVSNADAVGKSNNGAVYLVRNIDSLSGDKDLATVGNFDVAWNGVVAGDLVGDTNGSGFGVQLANLGDDANASNDLIIASYLNDFNSAVRTNSGAVYLVKNIVAIASNSAPDINIVQIDNYSDSSGLPAFSYYRDGNLTIDFNVLDDGNSLKVDLNYSSTSAQGTGTVIVSGLDLNSLLSSGSFNCADTAFNNSTRCSIDLNIKNVADGNYWILASLSDGSLADFNVSDNNFMVDNNKASTRWDGNASWQTVDMNVRLTCSDGTGSGCASTKFRRDYDSSSGTSFGAWQTYTGNLLFSSDGNYAIDFNSTDNAGNVGDSNRKIVYVDKTNPTASITNSSFLGSGYSFELTFSGSDSNGSIKKYWVSSDGLTWIDNGTTTSYTFSLGSQASLPQTANYYVKSTDQADRNSSVVSAVVLYEAGGGGGTPRGVEAVCGNGLCESGETSVSCPNDCTGACGDGVCGSGETHWTCASDCDLPSQTCGEQRGIACESFETCSDNWLNATDTAFCCLGFCTPKTKVSFNVFSDELVYFDVPANIVVRVQNEYGEIEGAEIELAALGLEEFGVELSQKKVLGKMASGELASALFKVKAEDLPEKLEGAFVKLSITVRVQDSAVVSGWLEQKQDVSLFFGKELPCVGECKPVLFLKKVSPAVPVFKNGVLKSLSFTVVPGVKKGCLENVKLSLLRDSVDVVDLISIPKICPNSIDKPYKFEYVSGKTVSSEGIGNLQAVGGDFGFELPELSVVIQDNSNPIADTVFVKVVFSDLVFEGRPLVVPVPLFEGDSFEVRGIVKNVGRVDSDSFEVSVYVDEDLERPVGTVVVSGGVKAGESKQFVLRLGSGGLGVGSHVFLLKVDSGNSVVEGGVGELNNSFIGEFDVEVASGLYSFDEYSSDELVWAGFWADKGVNLEGYSFVTAPDGVLLPVKLSVVLSDYSESKDFLVFGVQGLQLPGSYFVQIKNSKGKVFGTLEFDVMQASDSSVFGLLEKTSQKIKSFPKAAKIMAFERTAYLYKYWWNNKYYG